MKRTAIILAVMLAVSLACEDPTGILGPLGFGVVEGRDQEVSAVEAQLPEPVVARVWQDASGNAFLGIGPRPLYAQTGVKGVAGAVVCVGETPIEGEPIIPHARCTNTDAEGDATFHMSHPKKAGQHRTPIVAEVNGQALTPDTVTAVVEAGPAVSGPLWGNHGLQAPALHMDSTWAAFREGSFDDEYGNAVPFRAEVDAPWAEVRSTDTDSTASRTVYLLAPVGAGDTTAVRFYDARGELIADALGTVVHIPYSVAGELRTVWAIEARPR